MKDNNNTSTPKEWETDFVEKGADLEHTRWAKWQEYFFSKCKTGRIDEDDKEVVLVLPRGLYDRWWLQINTLYSEISEAEKESDRREVRQYLPLLKEIISQEREKWVEEKVKELKGHIISRIDFGCFSAKINNWDVDQREDYARRMEKEIINLLQK